MSNKIVVSGDISLDDVESALKNYLIDSGKKIEIGLVRDGEDSKQAEASVFLHESAYDDLQKKLAAKIEENKDLEKSSNKALASVATFHTQQKQLFDEFVLLRQRYDDQKNLLMDALWNKCAEYHQDLNDIPAQENEDEFVEDEDHVGVYNLGEVLGEGQFASVKSCSISHSRAPARNEEFDIEYAIKMLNKERILSFHSLKRVSNEVNILKLLRHEYIVSLRDVIQTKKFLYIITEKGGEDLFEFFDEHPDGVPEDWAREIMKCALKGVAFCHKNGICHRDLKPENILVEFDVEDGKCHSLKLCDFGLAAHFKTGPDVEPFTDFCGSPGFFAPEMIIRGKYYGGKVDVWSCGCILLELVLGHERFCELWMTPYDFEVMQDKGNFTKEIIETLERLVDALDFSDNLNHFILQFLSLSVSRRPSMKNILSHPWLQLTDLEKEEYDLVPANMTIEVEAPVASPGAPRPSGVHSPGAGEQSLPTFQSAKSIGEQDAALVDTKVRTMSSSNEDDDNQVDAAVMHTMYAAVSEKERKMYDKYNQKHNDEETVHLPPLEPQTPNVGRARKILLRGADLANKIVSGGAGGVGKWSNSPLSSPGPRYGKGTSSSRYESSPLLSPASASSSLVPSPMQSSYRGSESPVALSDPKGPQNRSRPRLAQARSQSQSQPIINTGGVDEENSEDEYQSKSEKISSDFTKLQLGQITEEEGKDMLSARESARSRQYSARSNSEAKVDEGKDMKMDT